MRRSLIVAFTFQMGLLRENSNGSKRRYARYYRAFLALSLTSPTPMNDAAPADRTHAAPSSISARLLRGALSVLAALMCSLALGALIGLVSLFVDIHACWLMLIGAPLLTWVLRASGSLSGRAAPLAAAAAVVLAGAYAEYLDAIARVAAVTGASFAESWHLGGAALMFQIAELGLSPLSLLVYSAAALLAAFLATRGHDTHTIPTQPSP